MKTKLKFNHKNLMIILQQATNYNPLKQSLNKAKTNYNNKFSQELQHNSELLINHHN